jgi:methionyl-tRNA formyltransferase
MSAMDKRLLIACGERTELELIEVQVEGRKRMSGTAFMNGHHLQDDEMLGVKVA